MLGVTIHEVEVSGWWWATIMLGFGLLADEFTDPRLPPWTTLVAEHGLTPEEPYVLCSLPGNLKISETVDVPHMLVSMRMPKGIIGGL